MAKRLQVLEARDETYERRLENERKAHAENITKLQAQLDKERAGRKIVNELLAEMQQNRKQRRPVGPHTSANLPSSNLPGPGGLMMRTRPKSNFPPAAAPRQRPPATQIQEPSPAPSVAGDSPRLSYSQCVRGSATAQSSAFVAPLRRDSLIPSPSPSPGAMAAGNSSPDLAGFTLRSRRSGSRLPLAVNPATPIRSGTPITHHDLSSTDSTQYSMSDSVFSRLSLSKASVAGTSVAGTPPVTRSPAVVNARKDTSPTAVPKSPHYGEPGPEAPPSPEVPHGLGLGLTDRERRESITSGTGESIRDTASVTSSAAFPPSGMLSPVLSGSALSSPTAAYASAETVRRGVPSLPTAQSWADVARRQKRG
jgi:hypothetical protein